MPSSDEWGIDLFDPVLEYIRLGWMTDNMRAYPNLEVGDTYLNTTIVSLCMN